MYTIEDRSIMFSGGASHTFDDIIAEVIEFEDVIVVRLENQGWKRCNENIYGLDLKAQVLWQIEERVHSFAESHYVNIYRKIDMVDAYNWDGTILTLYPKTGEVMSQASIQSPTKRKASKRQL